MYKVIPHKSRPSAEELEKWLNDRAKEGLELVTIKPNGKEDLYVFYVEPEEESEWQLDMFSAQGLFQMGDVRV